MPQMSPLMWFSLFILFSVVMIMFNQLNFFSYKPHIIKSTKKSMMKSKNKLENDNKPIFHFWSIN